MPLSSPADLPNLRIEPRSPTLQADSLPSEPPGKPPVQLKKDRDKRQENWLRVSSWKNLNSRPKILKLDH